MKNRIEYMHDRSPIQRILVKEPQYTGYITIIELTPGCSSAL
jgi:hypothetical protein